ncbi:MAG TPA: TVP38/TMEM64 family protein [Candidatus Binatia bacterium]
MAMPEGLPQSDAREAPALRQPKARLSRRAVGLIVAGVAVLVVGAVLATQVDWRALDAHAIAERVRAAGPIGPLALFALLVVQCVIAPLPSEPLMMAAGFLYGPWAGFVLAWAGVMVGATACFVVARKLGRPVVERFASPQKLALFDEQLARRGLLATFLAVLGVRALAHGSFDIVSYACGLIAFPLPLFLLASGVGVVPKVFAFTYLGASAGERPGWLDATILVGTFGVLLALPWWWRARRRRASAA